MGKCVSCGKSGLFLKLNAQNRCSECAKASKAVAKKTVQIEKFEKKHGAVLDKHFKLAKEAGEAYRTENYSKAVRLCQADIALLPKVEKAWEEEKKLGHFKQPPRISAFKLLAQAYEKQGKIEDAIRACDNAIASGYGDDGTKGGMSARKKSLEKKLKSGGKK